MGETIRWGILGSGMMGIEHINNLKLMPGAVITALADPVAASLARAAAAVGTPVAQFGDAAQPRRLRAGRCGGGGVTQFHPR